MNSKIKQVGIIMFNNIEMAVYLYSNGGLFAIDVNYVEQEAGTCYDLFEGIEFEPE